MPERRLARLRRLERVRANARLAALADAAQAEATLAQLRALAGRTRMLAADYAVPSRAEDGLGLRQQMAFGDELRAVGHRAEGEAGRARAIADVKARELAAAERRRAAVEERVIRAERAVRRPGDASPARPRRTWHGS